MADINVERKGPSIWPWIIGLIVLALLIWALLELFGDEEVVEEPVLTDDAAVVAEAPVVPLPAVVITAEQLPGAVQEFTNTCGAPAEPGTDMGREHEYTASCIEQLAAALSAVVTRDNVQGTDVSQRLESLRQRAQTLRASAPTAATHANTTKQAFTAATDLMAAVHQAGYTGVAAMQPELQQVQSSAQGINGTTPMLEQRDAVHSYFREAADVLRMLAENPAAP